MAKELTAAKMQAVKEAEEKIQRILLDLEDVVGEDVNSVDVDTRQFANLRVEIWFD